MAKPNYQYEKRQRELAKKAKKAEKEAERAARKAAGGKPEDGDDVRADDTDSGTDGQAPATPGSGDQEAGRA